MFFLPLTFNILSQSPIFDDLSCLKRDCFTITFAVKFHEEHRDHDRLPARLGRKMITAS
jgi:hypothetical protein